MMRIFSPAKLNLSLHLGDRRSDGFHTVDTTIQTVSLGDTLTIDQSSDTETVITCSDPTVPTDERNLVYRAIRALQKRGLTKNGFRIHIDKQIPVQGGLGGASSNAAAVLRYANEVGALGLSTENLLTIAHELGSDVPACVLGGAVHGVGRGELVTQVDPLPPCWFVIVDTGVRASSADAYAWWDTVRSDAPCTHRPYEPTLDWVEHSSNDFETLMAQRFPAIQQALTMLRAQQALRASLTGSGGCVYGVFISEKAASEAARQFPHAWACEATT